MTESVFAAIYEYWAWLGIPVMAAALAMLVKSILGAAATVKRAHLFRAPLAERQEILLSGSGRIILSTEGPRFSARFARVNFELSGIDGDPVEGRRVLFRARTSGISTARTELLKYDVPRPGRYVLRMTGLGAAREGDARHAVVFMRPHLKQSVAYILGILAASGVFITSLVFFLLRVLEPATGA